VESGLAHQSEDRVSRVVERSDVSFQSGGITCRAWLYRPAAMRTDTSDNAPCVVMAHGFAGTRDARLPAYAERFVVADFAVLLFDYRHFGASDGEPRQLISVRRQLEDYASAIAFARSLPEIDGGRIALWGTSFSGGHVLTTAARDSRIAAIVAQCPMMDGRASVLQIWRYAGLRQILRLTAHGTFDLLMALFGATHWIKAAGPTGSLAVITSNGAVEGFRTIAPKDFRWEVAARIAVLAGFYRPVRSAQQVRCPALIQICQNDSVVPPEAAEAVARIMGDRAEVCRYPLEHFDPYIGENFERSVTDEIDFLCRHLKRRNHD